MDSPVGDIHTEEMYSPTLNTWVAGVGHPLVYGKYSQKWWGVRPYYVTRQGWAFCMGG